MKYICPVCDKVLARELMTITRHTEKHIIDAIKKKHPKWASKDGTCNKCYSFYKDQMSHK